jgi:hypothetical protein
MTFSLLIAFNAGALNQWLLSDCCKEMIDCQGSSICMEMNCYSCAAVPVIISSSISTQLIPSPHPSAHSIYFTEKSVDEIWRPPQKIFG